MPRILFVNHTGRVSGAEKVLLQMLKGLPRSGFALELICAAEGSLQQEAIQLGVPCKSMPSFNVRFSSGAWGLVRALGGLRSTLSFLRREFRTVNPSIIHANTVRAGIVSTIASVGLHIPVVWHVHDILPRHHLSTLIRLLAYASRRTHPLCVSHATARAFAGALNFRQRITVLHNGIDLTGFPRKNGDTAASNDVRDTLGVGPHDFLFTTVGQIAPRKGLRELLSAFKLVAERHTAARLLIVGEPIFNEDETYYQALRETCQREGLQSHVLFCGARSDISRIMRASNVFVLNSLQEPFGLVLLEAMASGTAIVACNVGGIPEIITDGVTGWLVPPQDTQRLAARLASLIDDEEQMDSVQSQARLVVTSAFSEDAFLASLQALYSNLLRRQT